MTISGIMLIVAGVGLLFVLGAWALWAAVRRWDRVNAIVAAAAPLPIRLANPWDAVWVRGAIDCAEPAWVPHFGATCVHFSYKLEEHVMKTRTRDGKTETYWEWETRETKQDAAPFDVVQEDGRIGVDVLNADWQYEPTLSETLGKWRHSCSHLPFPGEASVIGVVSDDRRLLEPRMHVPLIVTPMERAAYLERVESGERWGVRGGLVLLLIGFFLVGFGLSRHFQTRGLPFAEWWSSDAGMVGGLTAGLACLVFWGIRTFNSLVTFRTRADQSWSGIDVFLKQRYDLIPNLVEVVRGYMKHEQSVLEDLTRQRAEALQGREDRIRAEGETVRDLQRIAVLAESYPDLQASAQFRKLAVHLTALEDKIAHARVFHNDSVAEYNLQTAAFPSSLIALLCGFKGRPLFAADLDEKAAPRFRLDAPG